MTDTTGMVKVGLHGPHGEFETMWATPVGPDRYRLENSPFYAYGVSWLDVVEARVEQPDGFPVFQRRVEKSGHRTVRLILLPGLKEAPQQKSVLDELNRLGCSFEGYNPRYFSIDIPPEIELETVVEYLIATGHDWEHVDPTYDEVQRDRSRDGRRMWYALTAFLALPGVVAFLVPWLMRPRVWRVHAPGLALLAIGTALLLWCVRDFYVSGRGSLAPWAPPERLVTVGLYRLSRNPMYVAVLTILAGWAVLFGTRGPWVYAGMVAIGFHLRVVLFEEPWLARRYAQQWEAYRARVPRWLGPIRR